MNIQVDKLCFSYDTREVLTDISFGLETGSFACLLGENGAGKSTLFRCMLGLLPPRSGDIILDGQNIRGLSSRVLAGKIAYVPQRSTTMHRYSVCQMVLMGTCSSLSLWGTPGKEQDRIVAAALERVGIAVLADREYAALSGGEQQLVLIARAIAQQARIMIMDEPCASLDYGNQIRILKLLKELAGQGYLIIQSTHNPDHALLYADQVMVLRDGRLCGQGSAAEVLTSEVLTSVYRVPVAIQKVSGTDKYICVPK